MWVDESVNDETRPSDSRPKTPWGKHITQVAGQMGQFAYDPATLTRIADRWQRLADQLGAGIPELPALTGIRGPGLDPASQHVANRMNAAGQSYSALARDMRTFCLAQAERCREALRRYSQTEDQHHRVLSGLMPQPRDGAR